MAIPTSLIHGERIPRKVIATLQQRNALLTLWDHTTKKEE
jgi:hypothetical protein